MHTAYDLAGAVVMTFHRLLLIVCAASWGLHVTSSLSVNCFKWNGEYSYSASLSLTQTLTGTKKDFHKENINHQWKSGAKFKVSSWI